MKVTYAHPNLALLLLDWLDNKNEYCVEDKNKLKYFIKLQLKIIEEDNKHKIELYKLKMHQELFEKGKLTFEQFQNLVK